jgi:hypothetical protein
LPGGYVTGGCLFQTVWNELHGFEATRGIEDYDVFYHDARDLSAAAEAAQARRLATLCADLPLRLDVRNQARVHLWYEAEFGVGSPEFHSSEEGIDHFLAACCSFGMRRADKGDEVYAPYGYEDLFALRVRPNPLRTRSGAALAPVYARKTRRWCASWPRLRVIPWPAPAEPAPGRAGTPR